MFVSINIKLRHPFITDFTISLEFKGISFNKFPHIIQICFANIAYSVLLLRFHIIFINMFFCTSMFTTYIPETSFTLVRTQSYGKL